MDLWWRRGQQWVSRARAGRVRGRERKAAPRFGAQATVGILLPGPFSTILVKLQGDQTSGEFKICLHHVKGVAEATEWMSLEPRLEVRGPGLP